ncbi:MAG: lyase family protein [Pseudomonadota bacterium]
MNFLTAPIVGDEELAGIFDGAQLVGGMIAFEVALARVQAELGVIPQEAAAVIAEHVSVSQVPMGDLSAGVAAAGVPVPSLVAALRSAVPEPHNDWLHWGATSQDVLDTAFVLTYRRGLDELQARLGTFITLLEEAARKYARQPMLARTRGQLATPISLGLRIAQWAQPLIALEGELGALRPRALKVQFGGAAGSQSAVLPHGPGIAKALALDLGLAYGAPWHTDRSGLGALSNWLHRLATALGKMGRDLATSSRGEVGEITVGQGGGSSTMPHKSNPVGAEMLQTVAYTAHGLATGLSAAATHGEERDGAAWPVEWLFLPQLFEAAGAGLRHAHGLMRSLHPHPDRMAARIADAPEVMSEAVVFALAKLVGRTEAERQTKEAMAAGKSLDQALNDISGGSIRPRDVLDLGPSLDAACAVIDEIFAARR